jgi:hypothetical protein
MSNGLGLIIESLVAVLLLLTITFCLVLNGRLKKLKADEQALKGTIAELITATEIAERAIAGLKSTVREADDTLGEHLKDAERFCAEIRSSTEAGADVLDRITQIAGARPWLLGVKPKEPPQPQSPDPKFIIAAAKALAERAQARAKANAA